MAAAAAAACAFRGVLAQPHSKTSIDHRADTAREDPAWVKQPLPPQWHRGHGQEAGSVPHPPRARGDGTSLATSSVTAESNTDRHGETRDRPAMGFLSKINIILMKQRAYLVE